MTESHLGERTRRDAAPAIAVPLSPLRVRYAHEPLARLLADPRVLAVFGFGRAAPAAGDPRYLRVALEPITEAVPFEVWSLDDSVDSAVEHGRAGDLRWACAGGYAFGALALDEAACGGLAAAAELAYQRLAAWLTDSATPHLLRCWNYLDGINQGDGDAERYREFCTGRAAGLRGFAGAYPAATAIGSRDGDGVLQLYWLAARAPGTALENPRQLSAWRYPRQYGPTPPSFARALRAPTRIAQVYISGTAAIVGHASHHRDDCAAQLDEALVNLAALLDTAGVAAEQRFGADSPLKVYLRDPAQAARALQVLQARLPPATPLLLLSGDICRRELLVEIDGLQTA